MRHLARLLALTLLLTASTRVSLANDSVEHEIEKWTKRIQESPDDPMGYKQRGYYYMVQKSYSKARSDFDRVVTLQPLEDFGYVNRGVVEFLDGHVAEGLEDLERGIALGTRITAAWFYRGEIRRIHGRWAEALEDYKHALTTHTFPIAFVRRAEAEAALGDPDAALASYAQALIRDRTHVECLLSRARFHWDQGDEKAALADARRAMDLNPRDPKPLIELARLRLLIKEPTEAITLHSRALDLIGKLLRSKLVPAQRGHVLAMRGEIHRRQKRFVIALADLDEALEATPHSYKIHQARAEVLEALQRADEATEARRQAREALGLSPEGTKED